LCVGQVLCSIADQHPLSEPPTISVRLAEPPSDVGTGGGQIGEAAWLAAAAVEVADCVEVLSISPGNCNGTWDVFDDDALMPEAPARLDPPTPPIAAVPVAENDSLALPKAPNPVDNEKPDGRDCVATLSGSVPTPTVVDAVCAWAPVMPNAMIASQKSGRIARLLC
jgi:hypothetical protein